MDHFGTFSSLIAHWRARDIDRVLALMTDDIVYHFHVGTRPAVGKPAVAKFLARMAARQTAVRWRVTGHAVAGDRLFVEGVDDYTTAEGRTVTMPYAGVIDFRDGLIRGWRDYVDLAGLRAQEAGEPVPDWLLPLIQAGAEA